MQFWVTDIDTNDSICVELSQEAVFAIESLEKENLLITVEHPSTFLEDDSFEVNDCTS